MLSSYCWSFIYIYIFFGVQSKLKQYECTTHNPYNSGYEFRSAITARSQSQVFNSWKIADFHTEILFLILPSSKTNIVDRFYFCIQFETRTVSTRSNFNSILSSIFFVSLVQLITEWDWNWKLWSIWRIRLLQSQFRSNHCKSQTNNVWLYSKYDRIASSRITAKWPEHVWAQIIFGRERTTGKSEMIICSKLFIELCAKWIRIDAINFAVMVFILTFVAQLMLRFYFQFCLFNSDSTIYVSYHLADPLYIQYGDK